jgi:hypothetical protein
MLAGWLCLAVPPHKYVAVAGWAFFLLCMWWPDKKPRRVVRRVLTDIPLEEFVVNHVIATGKVCYGHVNKDGSYTIEELQ